MLSALLITQSTSAFYDSNLGRWINRDPIGEEDGPNLYTFVANNSISKFDPVGLSGCSRAPCADPCGDAKKQGLNGSSIAGVVCCGGKKYNCVWTSGGISGASNNKAVEIVNKCANAHEDDHHDDIDCPRGPGITRPPFKKGKNPKSEECSAYKVHLNCLKTSISACDGNPQCINQVLAEIKQVNARIKANCGP